MFHLGTVIFIGEGGYITISLFGNKQDMICTPSGHYAIPICRARISKENQMKLLDMYGLIKDELFFKRLNQTHV